jgi:ubiquitin-conjugating enzyme E2 O
MCIWQDDSLISPYEGNLDENSSDSEWDTEDESDGSLNSEELTSPSRATDIGSLEEVTTTSKSEFQFDRSQLPSERVPVAGDTSTPIVYITAPTSCPPNFAVLEDPPPSNHYFITRTYSGSLRTCMKRLQKEYEVLQSSLPSGIFVRTWESRMNLMRVMMIGPEGTPYEHAPFVIDFCFTPDFSRQPPLAFFHSWTDGQGRINPNLYEDGKICLSILGTWPTRNPDESWIPGKSTVLQILVSIMGLVLVKAPFYSMLFST